MRRFEATFLIKNLSQMAESPVIPCSSKDLQQPDSCCDFEDVNAAIELLDLNSAIIETIAQIKSSIVDENTRNSYLKRKSQEKQTEISELEEKILSISKNQFPESPLVRHSHLPPQYTVVYHSDNPTERQSSIESSKVFKQKIRIQNEIKLMKNPESPIVDCYFPRKETHATSKGKRNSLMASNTFSLSELVRKKLFGSEFKAKENANKELSPKVNAKFAKIYDSIEFSKQNQRRSDSLQPTKLNRSYQLIGNNLRPMRIDVHLRKKDSAFQCQKKQKSVL